MMKPEAGPIDLMRRIGDRYRHIGEKHTHQPVSRGATRRRLARELRELEDRFERLLGEWVPDDALRSRWREFLRGHGAAPGEPALAPAPLFKGQTDAGTRIEVRPASGGYDVFADGARIDHFDVPWHLDPDMREPIQIGEHACTESFEAPEPAIDALGAFVGGGEAPWRWARELVEDGLVDAELALTPRGRRCVDRAREIVRPPPSARNFCVLVADAARARMFVLDIDRSTVGPATSTLVEVAELTNPMLRARDMDLVADSGSGRRLGAKAPLGGTQDRRDHRRRDLERHFAALVAEEAASVWRRYPACELIVAASPVMLGLLRPAIERQIRAKDQVAVHELSRDYSKLSAPTLHDRLAEDELLPPRGRRAPLVPAPGLPV